MKIEFAVKIVFTISQFFQQGLLSIKITFIGQYLISQDIAHFDALDKKIT
jgi:hypothetical protein